jgi:hypothetical protein
MIAKMLNTLGNMNSWLIIGVLALYILVLFLCAFFGEKACQSLSTWAHVLFSLTLGVYCSSWTFYGATGAAVREGIIFLPIYLGHCYLFGWAMIFGAVLGRVRRTMLFLRLPILLLHVMAKAGLWHRCHYSCRDCDYSYHCNYVLLHSVLR